MPESLNQQHDQSPAPDDFEVVTQRWGSELQAVRDTAAAAAARFEQILERPYPTEETDSPPTLEEVQRAFAENAGYNLSDAATPDEYVARVKALIRLYDLWQSSEKFKVDQLSVMAYIDIGQTQEESAQAEIEYFQEKEAFEELTQPLEWQVERWMEQLNELVRQEEYALILENRQRINAIQEEIARDSRLEITLKKKFIEMTIKPKLETAVARGEMSSEKAAKVFADIVSGHSQPTLAESYQFHDMTEDLEIGEDEVFLSQRVATTLIDTLIVDVEKAAAVTLTAPLNTSTTEIRYDKVRRFVLQDIDNTYPLRTVRNVELWKALLQSPEAQVVFGAEELRMIDEDIHKVFDRTIVSDAKLPKYAEAAGHFLSPQLVRNLLLHSAYKDRYLKNAIISLTEAPTWPAVLEEVCQLYPELGATPEEFTQNWSMYLSGEIDLNVPDIPPRQVESLQTLASRLLDNHQLKSTEHTVALARLDTPQLLQRAAKELRLPKDKIQTLLTALAKIAPYGSKSIMSIDNQNLGTLLRTALEQYHQIPSAVARRQLPRTEFHELFDLLQPLVARINTEDDPEKLQSLSSYEVALFITDPDKVQAQKDFLLHHALGIFEQVGEKRPQRRYDPQIGRDYGQRRDVFTQAIRYPDAYLNLDGAQMLVKVWQHGDLVDRSGKLTIIKYIASGALNAEAFFRLRTELPSVFEEEQKNIWRQLMEASQWLLRSPSQVDFYKELMKQYGKKALDLILQYKECISTGGMSEADHPLILEQLRHVRVLSPTILEGYREAKRTDTVEIYVAGLLDVASRMISQASASDADRAKPYFADLLKHVYANNSSQWTDYEKNEECQDRSSDVAVYKTKPKYQIDLKAAAEMTLKEPLDETAIGSLEGSIMEVAVLAEQLGYDQEKMRAAVHQQLAEVCAKPDAQGKTPDIDISTTTNNHNLLFLVIAEHFYGDAEMDATKLKKIILLHLFTEFENIKDYIQGTNDRVAGARYEKYALLSELHTFFSDRIKEAGRVVTMDAYGNQTIEAKMAGYFNKLSEDGEKKALKARIGRLQLNKMGLAQSFIDQMGKTLNRGRARQLTNDEVVAVITRYQNLSRSAEAAQSTKDRTRAFRGQLQRQVMLTAQALSEITGESVAPADVKLATVSIDELLHQKEALEKAGYNPEFFASFTVQRMTNLFADEISTVERELNKYEAEGGVEGRLLNAYITKSKESANARMVGGVCVSGDNPSEREDNLWDMPNYLQMVFQDPETSRCQGLVLMHVEEQDGEKILSLSLNPSSTYLYQVDEKALLAGIMNAVTDFAASNQFDKIVVSKNVAIRSNRTGGMFEKALEEMITRVSETHNFRQHRVFSYNPEYMVGETDVLWKNPLTTGQPAEQALTP